MASGSSRIRDKYYAFGREPLKKLIPHRLKPILRWADPIHLQWYREDPSAWPAPENMNKPGLEQFEYSIYSQNGEDGILRHLYNEIGFGSKTFLEFGFEGTQNNSLRLILFEGFRGTYLDGSKIRVAQFKRAARIFGIPGVAAFRVFLTRENLVETLCRVGTPEEIDLLSIDVDGNDYWFWEAITSVSPRIVVIEYNASLGPDLSLTVPYDPSFHCPDFNFYHGASLVALERLGKRKGYSLVGCDSRGVNAFFVRNDCMKNGSVAVVPAKLAYMPHRTRLDMGFSPEAQLSAIRDMQFVEID